MDAEIEQKNVNVKQKIIELIKIKGPVIPVQVAREISSDILMASAHLSELSSDGKLKISSVKVGGTPLYYLPGQEQSLEQYSTNLHEKERNAFDLLKEKKILRDSQLEPVIRVALREVKDFAIPLQVTYQNNKEIFWKWHLMGKEEASSTIKNLLSKKEDITPTQQIKKENETEAKKQSLVSEEAKPQIQKPIKEKPKEDIFLQELESYFTKNRINIKSSEIIRKNTETDFILEIPSAIGNLEYYCKAKNKKRVSDTDLSSAYAQGHLKKLPVLFLTKGELTKKAKETVDRDFKQIKINKI